jgi:sigma-B regulation protein RsbU (phosphoserine phosphatase)
VASIVTLGPQDVGKVYRLDAGECLIGRRLDCHICVPDQRISRRHARIRRESDGYALEDLGSCNGSFVNGRRIQGSARLRHGDEVEIGASRFRIDLSDEMVAQAESTAVRITQNVGDNTINMIEVAHLGLSPKTGLAPPPKGTAPVALDASRLERKLQAMYRISETVASTLDANALLQKVCGILLEVFPQASAVAAVTFDPRSKQLRTQAARRRKGRETPGGQATMDISQQVVDRVLRQGQSVLLRATTDTPIGPMDTLVIKNPLLMPKPDGTMPSLDEGAVGWRMGAPLSFRGEHLGILHVDAESALGYFTQDDLDLLQGLASQSGIALHLIGLHQRLLARDRLDYDLRLARQIQRNLLPREPPKVSGLDFAVHYEPAFHVGGDFYDFLWLDPTRLAMVVGDVSGKAISGALFMARVTSEIRFAAPVESHPRRIIQRVNRALAEVAEDGMFVTMVFLSLDLTQQVLRFSNAGHTTPLLLRGGKVTPLEYAEARCLPVGVEARVEVAEAQVKLLPGDVLVLYTDGIIEARSMTGEFYGVERLHAVLQRTGGTARQVLEAVLADLDKFVEDAPQADDQTVVCVAVSETSSKRFESVLPARG